MAYNPFDDVILNDPAYMANGGPMVIPQRRNPIQRDPAEEERQRVLGELERAMAQPRSSDPTKEIRTALNPFGQPITDFETQPIQFESKTEFAPRELDFLDKAQRKFYETLTGDFTREEAFGKEILGRQLAMAQAFAEAGRELDPNRLSASNIELQDPVLGPLLKKYGYKRGSLSEGVEATLETFFRDQRKSLEKKDRGEELDFTEKVLASKPMFFLDALDFTGIFGLATTGALKVGARTLKFLNDARATGKPVEEVRQTLKTQFPEDANKIGINYHHKNFGLGRSDTDMIEGGRTTERFTEQDVIARQAQEAEEQGLRFKTGKPPKGPEMTFTARPKVQVSDSLKKELEAPNLSNDKKIVKAVIEELDEGRKYTNDADFVKAIEDKTGIKDLSVRKISLAKDKQVSQKRLKIPFKLRDPKVGIIGKYRPSETGDFLKVVQDIRKRQGTPNAVKPGELTKIARDNNINVERLRQQFPELVVTGRPTPETLQASAEARRLRSVAKVNEMIAFKNQYALRNQLDPNEISFEEIARAMRDAGLVPLEGKKIKQYLKSGEITEDEFKQLLPRSPLFREAKPSTGDEIQDIIDGSGSEYQKATDIVSKFGFTVDTGNPAFAKYLANSARTDLKSFVEDMRNAGAMTADEFAQSDEFATGLYKNRAEYNKTILDEILNSRMNDDLARGEEPNIPLFNFSENARRQAMDEVDEFLRKTFLDETNDKKLLKMRDAFLKEYGGTLKRKIDLSTQRGQDSFIRNLKKIFGPQLAHTAPIGGQLSSKVIGDFADNIRINPAAYNVQIQVRVERGIQSHFRKLRKALKKGDKKEIKDLIKVLKNYDKVFNKRNMGGFYKIPEIAGTLDIEAVLKRNGLNVGDGRLFLGKEKQLSPDNIVNEANIAVKQVKDYFEKAKKNPKLIKFHKKELGRAGSAEERKKRAGLTSPIRKGFPVFKFDKTDLFKKGGAVRMAIGGDPLQNINQQQFMPDPAFDGQDFFQQAVDSGNLTAFNPTKLFKVFGKVDAVETPKKKIQTDTQVGPPGTTLPATQQMQPSDFAFKSFTLETIMDPNAPKAARPQDWQNFFKGKAAPEAELNDSGIMQYLSDFAQYYPNQKITQKQLVDFYETSPMGNISIKVKQDGTNVPADPAFLDFLGRPRHKNAGNQPLDEAGQNYREVVVQSGPLPGEGKPFVASGHYSEENVLGFTRVADYKNVDGQTVAVIQELQTDMLTKVRKEQERLNALLKRIENIKERANQRIQQGDIYDRQMGERALENINNEFPPATLEKLQQNLSAIKPFPNTAGKELIPTYAKELRDLQEQINKLADIDIQTPNPETLFSIANVETQQQKVLDNLLDLTRDSELERDLKAVKVPSSDESDTLTAFGQSSDSIDSVYGGFKDLELFPPIPFNKQPDYVDLLLKATIKDAQTKGINKVAIMPADKVNQRWGKDPTGAAGVKFNNLYGKVTVQQMKNIAKKYKGNVAIEKIVDNTKPSKALRFLNRDVDGGLKLNKEDVARRTTADSEEGLDEFYNEQIRRFVSGGGYRDKDVVLTREVAPGQFQDFFVRADDDSVNFVPLGEGDTINDALIVIEEFNPQLVDMVTLTLDSPQSKGPFYMFKKKDGGTIAKDSLVSITDIFGQYGR